MFSEDSLKIQCTDETSFLSRFDYTFFWSVFDTMPEHTHYRRQTTLMRPVIREVSFNGMIFFI